MLLLQLPCFLPPRLSRGRSFSNAFLMRLLCNSNGTVREYICFNRRNL